MNEEIVKLSKTFREAPSDYIAPSKKTIDSNEIALAMEACLDGWFTSGRFTHRFETEFASYMSQKYCLTVNSGSSANLVALFALTSPLLKERKISRGDEIVTVAAGFPTTVNPILQIGATPVFIDIDPISFEPDYEQLRQAIGPKTKAIVMAHTLGIPYNTKLVREICDEHKLWMVEDCCDAIGSTVNGDMVGKLADFATASFYPAHHITMGEGGAVMTSNSLLKKIALSFRDWGRDCWCPTGKDNTCGTRYDWKISSEDYDHKYIYSHYWF